MSVSNEVKLQFTMFQVNLAESRRPLPLASELIIVVFFIVYVLIVQFDFFLVVSVRSRFHWQIRKGFK